MLLNHPRPEGEGRIQFIRKMSWTLLSGIVIGMVFNMEVLPMWLEKDINGYPILMVTMSSIAIPLLLLEYFYTRERITEDVVVEHDRPDEEKIPLRDQMKALLSNKYFVILIVIATVSGIVDNFKGGNVQYFYIKFMLGGAENPRMYTIYQVVTGVPLGIGAFAIYPLAKKVGILNLTVGGYALVLILLPFVDVEKKLPEINAELLRRKKESVPARGEGWVDPEEQERLDAERADAEREANRIADLKAICREFGRLPDGIFHKVESGMFGKPASEIKAYKDGIKHRNVRNFLLAEEWN